MERLIEDPAVSARSALLFNDGTRTTIRARTIWTRCALAAITASIGLLVSGVSTAAAAPAATAAPTSQCWLQVVNDWLDNNRVDGVYAIPCYTQAIQHLNAYPDVKNYSSATDDIQRALLAAIRQDRGNGPGAGPGPSDPSSGSPGRRLESGQRTARVELFGVEQRHHRRVLPERRPIDPAAAARARRPRPPLARRRRRDARGPARAGEARDSGARARIDGRQARLAPAAGFRPAPLLLCAVPL